MEQWERQEIMSFWGRHYFPANATLYVVGDIDVQVRSRCLFQLLPPWEWVDVP